MYGLKTNIIALISLLLFSLAVAGCTSSENGDKAQENASQKEVYIVAAASMTDAVKEIGANYENSTLM